MQAISSDEITLIPAREFNSETYRVSYAFQVVICRVYVRTSLPFSNSRQETIFSLHSSANCHLLHSLIEQIYRLSFLLSSFSSNLSHSLSSFVCHISLLLRFILPLFFTLSLSFSPRHPNITSRSVSDSRTLESGSTNL